LFEKGVSMGRRKTNPDFLTGIPEMLVLQLLSGRAMHGYAVVQAIKLRSGQQLQFGESSIYPVLHRLESDGMLETQRETVRGRERVVYQVTPKGLERLKESRSTWESIVGAVGSFLKEDGDGQKAVA